MSYSTYTPNSFQSPLFASRNEKDGIYDTLLQSFKDAGPTGLCNAEYKGDFHPHSTDSWSGNYTYVDNTSSICTFNVLGEVLGEDHGTLLGAQGNHYPGANNDNVLTDYRKAKPVIVLGTPSGNTTSMADIFFNQICTFLDIRASEQSGETGKIYVKEIVKSIKNDGVLDTIVLTGGLLYTRKIDDRDNEAPVGPTPTDAGAPVLPKSQDVFVNARYNCRLMTGYGGNAYNQCYAGLVQPRWVDLDGDLIKPWEFHDKVRPGTLIVANISLQVFVIPQSNGPYKTKKIYNAVINLLRVMAESDLPIALPCPFVLGQSRTSQPSSVSAPTEQSAAAAAFANILPSPKSVKTRMAQSPGASTSSSSTSSSGDITMSDSSSPIKQKKACTATKH
ncbi:hypothetical protein C8R41DRAFT_923064 [Lentinula lateritia]|uniref:Uncharacterized protein n=1 Tax=Lentinula lateritia TaxID=40482 RepID=A0ABQ8V6Y1_9AGAR|nr:hypothetical protein C8R41DRAFT_923064 [Lentinula lateritia]